jgi:uncharacterized protein (DUF924 family)
MPVTDPLPEPADVLRFWLEETPRDRHFARDDALDGAIRERFGALHALLSQAVPPGWRATAEGRLAAVIVLDQFSRNLHRDSAAAFANDAAALALARHALGAGDDRGASPLQLQFLYLPFMHAEDPGQQARSEGLFSALAADAPEMEAAADYARRHAEVINRFGRFPSRNAALGRESTDEERAFLADHPEGF